MRSDTTPSVNVCHLVRLARGRRRNPGVRPRPSTGPLRASTVVRATVRDEEVWSFRASIATYGGDRGELELSFSSRGVPYRPTVELRSEPARFGGVRWFAVCPGCGKGCRRVWLRGLALRCRTCAGVAWSVWSEREGARAVRAASRVHARFYDYLGHAGGPDDAWDMPEKPRTMKRRTFEDLEDRHREAIVRQLRSLTAARGL